MHAPCSQEVEGKGRPLAATDDKLMARLLQIRDRQEALIQAVDGQTDCIGILDAKLSELLEWANKPPSGSLGGNPAEGRGRPDRHRQAAGGPARAGSCRSRCSAAMIPFAKIAGGAPSSV